jgi:hypothetical protein
MKNAATPVSPALVVGAVELMSDRIKEMERTCLVFATASPGALLKSLQIR